MRSLVRTELEIELVVAGEEHPYEWTRAQLLTNGVNFGEFFTSSENFEKYARMCLGLPQRHPLAENDGPRHQREDKQYEKNGEMNRTRFQYQLEGIEGRRGVDRVRRDFLQELRFSSLVDPAVSEVPIQYNVTRM